MNSGRFCTIAFAIFLSAFTPDVHAQEKVILVFGDSGTGSSTQFKIGKAMHQVCQKEGCHFALMLGDNIYEKGVENVFDKQFQDKFEKPYAAFGRFDFWAVSGNHDWRKDGLSQISYTAHSDRWRMPAIHYKVPDTPDWLHIYGFDTSHINDEQVAAARAHLCGKPGWRFIMGHHPIHSNGYHGDEKIMTEKVLPLVKECKIQVYFSGHDHDQEHITGMDFEQFVQGAAAKSRLVWKPKYKKGDTKRQNFATSDKGFAVARVTPARLQVKFFNSGGKQIYYWEGTPEGVGLQKVNSNLRLKRISGALLE
jgi:tartrate-resistant acid phosphatase type 5